MFNFTFSINRKVKMLSVILFIVFVAFSVNASYGQNFYAIGSGLNGSVYASIVFNGELIVGGTFTASGSTTLNRVAKWNGTSWAAMGSGFSGTVREFAIYNNALYACGDFTTSGSTTVNRIAKWNGTIWEALGLGLSSSAYSMCVWQNELYVGGTFTTAGGITANRIAKWNSTTWLPVANGVGGSVYALELYDSKLVVAGSYTNIGGITVNRISYWNGANWLPMANGFDNNWVNILYNFGGNLIAGGAFTTGSGVTLNRIAKWNGSTWSSLGTGTNGDVEGLYSYLGNLYAGGAFTTAGSATVNRIAKWDGTSWSNIGGTNGTVYTLNVFDAALILAGNFTTCGGSVSASNIAKWGSIPAVPTLISPPNASTGNSITPTLDWSDVSGASTYGVMLSNDPNFQTSLINVTGLTSSQYSVPLGVLNSGGVYFWKANAKNGIGTSNYTSIWFFQCLLVGLNSAGSEIPASFKLYDNYPNPFNPSTTIKFDVPKTSNIKLLIYNQIGQVVANPLDNKLEGGKYTYTFDGSNLSSGIYYCQLSTDGFKDIKKMLLVK